MEFYEDGVVPRDIPLEGKTIPGHPQYTLGPTLALNPMGFNQDFESKYALSPQQQHCCVLVLKLKHTYSTFAIELKNEKI